MADFTGRFTGRAEEYSKYRPKYPERVLDALTSEAGFDDVKVVADIGSGTGILSELFLENGNFVYCVEPNKDMRAVAEYLLGPRFPQTFKSVNGRAEQSTLGPRSVDLIVVGQALHWFDIEGARREFSRILRPDGFVCVLYNKRAPRGAFMASYERIVKSLRQKAPNIVEEVGESTISGLFSEYKALTFSNQQSLDLQGLLGRLLSASYAPAPTDAEGTKTLEKRVRQVFSKHSRNGRVTLLYETRMYLGRLKRTLSSPRTAS